MEEKSKNNIPEEKGSNKKKINRRDILKSLVTLPVVGVLVYGAIKKRQYDKLLGKKITDELDISAESPIIQPVKSDGPQLRIGIIGYGIRGAQLSRALGYAHPETIEEWQESAKADPTDKRYREYLEQEDLNVVIKGICDVFDVHAQKAVEASANIYREGMHGKFGLPAKRYKNYKELIASKEIDAVIIATPDHWHATMLIEAAKAGKHVYVEKPLTRTEEETHEIYKIVKDNNIVFQLGHQGRQNESYIKAKEAIDKEVLGKISLIEVCTNRNSPNGAWVYDIHPEANARTIDWQQFLGQAPKRRFSKERFFRWRCWWDYGTGLSGDLLTHEYDAINQVMNLGIPHSAVASGGIYFYKDGREVPDVFHATLEYPNRDLTFLYSATLASNRDRGKVIMGHDGHMALDNNLFIYADSESTRYKEKIKNGIIDPNTPIYSYIPGRKSVDAVTSATERYFAGRGLLYTYRGGKRVDTTHLHLKEWLEAIRNDVQPSCDIEQGYEEAITAHMATIAYREKRKVFWDKMNKRIV